MVHFSPINMDLDEGVSKDESKRIGKQEMGTQRIGFVMSLGFMLWSCFQFSTILAKTYHYNFTVMSTPYTRLCKTKNIMTVNGQFPGPTLNVHRGDTVYIKVFNEADHNVTLHWHGLKQIRDPWHDGPEYITQCAIQPKSNFTYKLNFTNEEGTIWWHAHSDWTRATVHGAVIIYPRVGTTYPYPKPDGEEIIILGEWWERDIFEILEEAIAYGGQVNDSDAFTINGQPGDLYNCSTNGTFRMAVEHGKTYLLRVINAALQDEHFFAVAGHNLTVVGEDGSYTEPLLTSYIMITPGQSYDLLLTADQTPGLYYIAARAYSSGTGVNFNNSTTTAILEYTESNSSNSTPILPSLPYYNDTDAATNFVTLLRSLATDEHNHPILVPKNVTKRLLFIVSVNTSPCANATCDGPNGNHLAASLNNISYQTTKTDILSAYYRNISGVFRTDFPEIPPYYFNYTADDLPDSLLNVGKGTNVTVLEYNTTVELVLQGTSLFAGENHPIHLHGYNYYIVGFGFGNFDPDSDPKNYNLTAPPRKNTAGVPRNGWIALRFTADNPGVWFMHCHLERHMTWGMVTVFIVKDGKEPENQMVPPPSYMPPC